MGAKSSQYFLLTVFFVLLSIATYAGLNWIRPNPKVISSSPSSSSPNLPTEALAKAGPSSPVPSSTFLVPSSSPPSPTPAFKTFTSSVDGFSVTYPSSRQLYQDIEGSQINRYTFYRDDSNFAIHVGRETWAWEHPNRDFSGEFLVSGQNTFRFETAGQTIVDLDKNGKKYTIQCIHHDVTSFKTECASLLKSFKLTGL